MKYDNQITLEFPSLSRNEAFARGVAAVYCAQLDPTLDELGDIKTAVSEAVTNCIVHAYPDTVGTVIMRLRTLEGEGFRVAVVRPPMVYGRGCKGNYNALSAMARKLPAFPRFENRRSVLYVENLAECLRLLIDGGAGGLYFPQDARVVSTAQIVAQIARARGRRIALLRGLNPLVRLLGRRGMARRAFGDLVYDPAMSTLPEGYRRFDFESSIRRTEIE